MNDSSTMPGIAELGPAARLAVFGATAGAPLPAADEWRAELGSILGERSSGLAMQRLADTGAASSERKGQAGTHGVGDLWNAMATAHRCDSLDALAIAAMTLPFLRTLREHHIECVVIKGLAVARHYPSSGMRPFRDVDIVVPAARFGEALALAREAGLRTSAHDLQPHPSFDLRCREGVNLADATGLVRLDLHHHVSPWTFSRHLSFERLSAHADAIEVHGHRVNAASPVHSLAVSMLHLISERWQKKLSLITWSDIAVLAGVIESADPAAAADELRRLDLDGIAAAVLQALPAHARPDNLMRALGRARVPLGSRVRLRLLDTGSVVGRHPASWAARLPLPNAAYFLAGSLVPSRAYLRSRFGEDATYRTWWSLAFSWARRAVGGHDVSSPYSTGRP